MAVITRIIFDNNGVLTTSDQERTHKRVSEFLGISISEFIELIDKFVKDLDKGKISQREFYYSVLNEGKINFPIENFAKVHLESYIPKRDVQEIAGKLSLKYDVYLLSNFGDAFWS